MNAKPLAKPVPHVYNMHMPKQRFQVTLNEHLVTRAFAHLESEGFNSLSEYLEHLIRQASATDSLTLSDATSTPSAPPSAPAPQPVSYRKGSKPLRRAAAAIVATVQKHPKGGTSAK